MRCADCNGEIALPDGKLDPTAREGDLCDECTEAQRLADLIIAEWRYERCLDDTLRRRP